MSNTSANYIHTLDAALVNAMGLRDDGDLPKSPDPDTDIHDEPCAFCNDQGPDTDDGESHACAFCGAMS